MRNNNGAQWMYRFIFLTLNAYNYNIMYDNDELIIVWETSQKSALHV